MEIKNHEIATRRADVDSKPRVKDNNGKNSPIVMSNSGRVQSRIAMLTKKFNTT